MTFKDTGFTFYDKAKAYWIGYFVFMCVFFYADTIGAYRNADKIGGVVVDQLYGRGRKRGYYKYPQVKFVYKDSSYLFGQSSGFAVGRFHVGKKVTVIFPKDQPDKAEIYSFFPYWISLSKLFFSFMITLFLFMMAVFSKWYGDFKREMRARK